MIPYVDKTSLQNSRTEVLTLLQNNRLLEAKELCEKICRMEENDAEVWVMLGAVNGKLGELGEVESCCNHAIALQPGHLAAHIMLGDTLLHQGQAVEAEQCYRNALGMDSDNPLIHFNLGLALSRQEQFSDAETSYRKALQRKAGFAAAHANLAYVLRKQGKMDEALENYQQALVIAPDSPEFLYNLGLTQHDLGRYSEAAASLRRVLQIQPDYTEAALALAYAQEAAGDYQEALTSYQEVLRIDPENAQAHAGLAFVHYSTGNYETALADCGQALHIMPDYADAHFTMASIYLARGDHQKAIAACREALRIQPDFYRVHSNLLMILNYSPTYDAERVYSEHVHWGQSHALPGTSSTGFSSTREQERRLRVGYISPDLYKHSVSFFFEPLLTNHDPDTFETFCYSDVRNPDETTERLTRLADHWRSISGMSDEQLVQQIRKDGIDILVDLTGHTANNRLRVFTARAAPAQVSYLGYPNTTGISAMDYRMTDQWADPVNITDCYHTEELIRLPHGFLCYLPPQEAPPVLPLPAETSGHITFGSFNNLAKITSETVATWSSILHETPDSRLVLKNISFTDTPTQDHFLHMFSEHEVTPERLDLMPPLPSTEGHLGLYGQVDIALDTFPYNGTTTTCEALWMGIPVVTLAGTTHAGRVGVSLLSQIGLTEYIAATPEAYVRIATNLAEDREVLRRLRPALREQLAASPLCNGKDFARRVESAYRGMWKKWCTDAVG